MYVFAVLVAALVATCSGVLLSTGSSSSVTTMMAAESEPAAALLHDMAVIRRELANVNARQTLDQVEPAITALNKQRQTQGKVASALASELPALVRLIQDPRRDPINLVSQSVRLVGAVIGAIPGGQVVGPVLRLLGSLFGDVFGASPQRRPQLSAERVRHEVDTVVRSHVWDATATARLDDAVTELMVAFNSVQPWLRAFEDPRNCDNVTGFRALTEQILAGDRLRGFRSPLDVQDSIIRAQRAIQTGAEYRDQQVRALAEGSDPSGLLRHMCTSWDWGTVNASGAPTPGTPCHLLLRQDSWREVTVNQQGNLVWPSISRWGDANGGECNRCTCVEGYTSGQMAGWSVRDNNFVRIRFNRHNSACVERADLLPTCTRTYRAAQANSQHLAAPAFFRDVITMHQNVVFGNMLAFFLMEPYISEGDLERVYTNVFRIEVNLRRAQRWGTGEPCARHYARLAALVQDRLPSTPTGKNRDERALWDNWCRSLPSHTRRICNNQWRVDGRRPTPAQAFNWRDYNVVRYAESVAG